jgi:hypothetical protein
VDTGERHGIKPTPVLISNGKFEHTRVAQLFKEHSTQIDQRIAKFVYRKIVQYQAVI